MKINLNAQFKNLSGKDFDKYDKDLKEIEMHNMAKGLATAMWLSTDKNIKFKLWGEDLYKTGSFEIDEPDFDLIIAWIEVYGTDPNKNFNPWFSQIGIKGQVIDSMKAQKEKLKKK